MCSPSSRRPRGFHLLTAPYLSPTLRASLAERGVSFADATGNLRMVAEQPGLFIERQGARKDPWPSDDALRSLRGRAAGRAVRALVDFRPPYGVRDLAKRASVPLGSLSRALDLLDREGLVTRDDRGSVIDIDWEGTIRRLEPGLRIRALQPDRLLPRSSRHCLFCLETLGGRLELCATGAFAASGSPPPHRHGKRRSMSRTRWQRRNALASGRRMPRQRHPRGAFLTRSCSTDQPSAKNSPLWPRVNSPPTY